MTLTVLGSSSAANGYLLDNGREALAIECGQSFGLIQNELNFDISRLRGVLLSHEHDDHSHYAYRFTGFSVPLYASQGTLDAMPDDVRTSPFAHAVEPAGQFFVGDFAVIPFDVRHDAAAPLGFLILHPDMGTLVFATDTRFLPYRFPDVETWLIECNYSDEILRENVRSGAVIRAQAERVVQSHMSLQTILETLEANDLSNTRRIVLLHLSDRNADASAFQSATERATGIPTYIARAGLKIKLTNPTKQ